MLLASLPFELPFGMLLELLRRPFQNAAPALPILGALFRLATCRGRNSDQWMMVCPLLSFVGGSDVGRQNEDEKTPILYMEVQQSYRR